MIVFAGPSLNSISRIICKEKSVELRPPVKRGDIRDVRSNAQPGSMAIVDGVFHQVLSVSHEEIIEAVDAGWQIFGLSSMGAIRAFELRDHGMEGFGKVFHRFLSEIDFQDDEVALLHLPGPDFTPMSEPLVHFRACLEDFLSQKFVTQPQYDRIIKQMKTRYFGDRTMGLFEEVFYQFTEKRFAIHDLDFDQYREKQLDLIEFLKRI